MIIQKGVKEKLKLKMAIYGVAGGGKSYTSLALAQSLGKKYLVICTEYGRIKKFSKYFPGLPHIVLEEPFTLDKLFHACDMGIKDGYDTIVIDSLSQFWYQLCEQIQHIANTRYNRNTMLAWGNEGARDKRRLRNFILSTNVNLIATMRSKTKYETTTDESGKTKFTRTGLAPQQQPEIEYEFDIVAYMDENHNATILKGDSVFQDRIIEKPDDTFAKELIEWCEEGIESYYDKMSNNFSKCKSSAQLASVAEQVATPNSLARLTSFQLKDLRGLHASLKDKLTKKETK